MIAAILQGLVQANLALAAGILLVLALRAPVRRAFGVHAGYALWLAAPLMAVGPFLPGRAPQALLAPIVVAVSQATAGPARSATPTAALLLVGLWLAGAGVAAAVIASRQASFLRALGRLSASGGEPDLYEAQRAGFGPAVVGALRPRIVVPADFDARFQGVAREIVLAHERAHLERGDAVVNAAVAAIQCLAWFNPVVHLAARLVRVDQELSCDALVVARFPAARRQYAEALLHTQLMSQALPLGCQWPATGVHPLKERVVMLNRPVPTSARTIAGAAVVAALGVAGACAAWAADPAPRLIDEPVWLQKPTVDTLKLYYPAEAEKAKLPGEAVIGCQVAGDGRLAECSVVRESPEGAGFGPAALQLSQHFQMAATAHNGIPTAGARIRIPIRFAAN